VFQCFGHVSEYTSWLANIAQTDENAARGMLAETKPSIRSSDADGADWLRFRLTRSALDAGDTSVVIHSGTLVVIRQTSRLKKEPKGSERELLIRATASRRHYYL